MDKTKWENMKTPEEKMLEAVLKRTPGEEAGIEPEELADAIPALPAIKTKRKISHRERATESKGTQGKHVNDSAADARRRQTTKRRKKTSETSAKHISIPSGRKL